MQKEFAMRRSKKELYDFVYIKEEIKEEIRRRLENLLKSS
jgi:vacuolar-type H+-ATPase subunit F/Vma7